MNNKPTQYKTIHSMQSEVKTKPKRYKTQLENLSAPPAASAVNLEQC